MGEEGRGERGGGRRGAMAAATVQKRDRAEGMQAGKGQEDHSKTNLKSRETCKLHWFLFSQLDRLLRIP